MNRMIPGFRLAIEALLVLSSLGVGAAAEPRQLRAGAAASNISPPLGLSINGNFTDHKATNIHDELHARCLVLDNGIGRIGIVVVDSCMVPREIFDEAKQIIQKETGIPADHLLMSATHTHSAPAATPVFQSDPDPAYQQFLTRRIADGIRRAVANLAPARISWGIGSVPGQVFNRRWKMKPGTLLRDPFGGTNDLVKMNPNVGDPNLLEPAGPTDPQVCFISVQHTNGRPMAVLANYSLHYCGGMGGGIVSADYYGAFADRLQQLLEADRQDPPFVAIMSNGTSGNINNIDFRGGQEKQPPFGQLRIVANDVAMEVARAARSLQYRDWVPLHAKQTEIRLGVRLPASNEVRSAYEILAQAKGSQLRTPEEVYARETALIKDYPPYVQSILQAIRIGDVEIVAIPCEVFVEVGLEIKSKNPFKPTFTISLANGYNGYLPTVEHHRQGGYETWRARSSYLEVEAAPKIEKAVFQLLDQLTTIE
jgi:hypothetical protein